MLGRHIYESTRLDIQDHATLYTTELRNELQGQQSLLKAIQASNRIANKYHTQIIQTVFNRLREIGNNAVDYYAPDLNDLQREQQVGIAMDFLVHNKYYGLTLPQRLSQSHVNLRRNIKRSASVGVTKETRILNITRVFDHTYPFGAQKNWDLRIFLAEAVRLEHVIARNIAEIKAYKLVRWTLSHTHSGPDICDRYATAVDTWVEDYISKQKLDLDPSGVYFLERIPNIPHPNCQCTLQHIYRTKRGRRKKPPKKLNIIQRILKAIFK